MELQLSEESVKKYLEKTYNEDSIISDVDEAKLDFLDDGWEDEFEDEYEAYSETGRGEAEAQVRMQIESDILGRLGVDYSSFDKQVGRTISEIITDVFPCLNEQ